ncbi:hypothetical protein RB595_002804 [Gaeumannomyces hyphopodioides]
MPTSTAEQRSYSRHLPATTMSNSSQNAYSSVSMPVSPPPPADLPSYSRTMHQHTKQQMEAVSHPSHRRGSRNHSQGAQQNGVSASYGPPTYQ